MLSAIVTGQYGGTPTGSVTFKEGKKVLGTAQLVNAQTTLTTVFAKTGSFTIAVTYSGDANYISSTSAQLVQTVEAVPPPIGLPILFVHGFCDLPASFQVMESAVQAFLQETYSQLYAGSGQFWTFYDGQNVNFEVPNGTTTYTSVPASTRFFAIAFDDPGVPLVQNFDPSSVAQISIYAKADELAHVIWAIKSITGAPRVIVVAHSMGGLVSRAYVEELGIGASPDAYLNDISTLVSLDTPQGGTYLLILQTLDIGPCWAQSSLDKSEMLPVGQDSVIPQLNYGTAGASPLPVALTAYSLVSYWTINPPLGGRGTDNLLTKGGIAAGSGFGAASLVDCSTIHFAS